MEAMRRVALGAAAGTDRLIDGVRLAFDDDGQGPAVVCLHAIGHGAGDFARLRARLRDRHRVIALDWPGQGRSGTDREPACATRYAALLIGLLDALGIGNAVLVGNSIGGAAALRVAHARPERVRALVLENPGGLADASDRMSQAAIGMFVRFFAAGARGARWFPAAFALYYRLVLQRAAAAVQRRRIVAAAGETAPVLVEAWRSFARPDEDLRTLGSRIACPVLFAWATRDTIVPLARSQAAIATFPAARIVEFPAGHAAHLETPEAFEDAVERFLATLEKPVVATAVGA